MKMRVMLGRDMLQSSGDYDDDDFDGDFDDYFDDDYDGDSDDYDCYEDEGEARQGHAPVIR